MAFTFSAWNSISRSTTSPKPGFFTYDVAVAGISDTLATITASDYFDQVAPYLAQGDLIYIIASDGKGIYQVTSATGAGTVTMAPIASNYKIVTLPVSFASGQQATHTLYFPSGAIVTKVRSFVTAAIAGTDNATITCQNNGGSAMANGVVTIPASSAVATEDNASPTTNNVFTAGQKMQLVCAKTTAGGTANVFVEYFNVG